jgi:hypothetical protein
LKPEQDEKEASQQGIADVVQERKFLHGSGAVRRDFILG